MSEPIQFSDIETFNKVVLFLKEKLLESKILNLNKDGYESRIDIIINLSSEEDDYMVFLTKNLSVWDDLYGNPGERSCDIIHTLLKMLNQNKFSYKE